METGARTVEARQTREIRLVIADDHAVVRDGLRALVAAQPGLVVIGEAVNGEEAWRHCCELRPDVVLLDVSMPIESGFDVAARIANDCPDVKILALTMHEERGYLTRLLRSGASGYVLKRTAWAELVRAIEVVAGGGRYVDPSLAAELLSERVRAAPSAPGVPTEITAREHDVLRHIARGFTNKEIAATLEISVKTVETHKANGMTKLGLGSRAALVRYALQEGWMEP